MTTFTSTTQGFRNTAACCIAALALMGMLSVGIMAQSRRSNASTATASSETATGSGGTASGTRRNGGSLRPSAEDGGGQWTAGGRAHPTAGLLPYPVVEATHDLLFADQGDRCTCNGATQSTKQIQCKSSDGAVTVKTQVCWQKKTLTGGKACGTVCDSAFAVCNGTASGTCRD
jgi:hypothetical protein